MKNILKIMLILTTFSVFAENTGQFRYQIPQLDRITNQDFDNDGIKDSDDSTPFGNRGESVVEDEETNISGGVGFYTENIQIDNISLVAYNSSGYELFYRTDRKIQGFIDYINDNNINVKKFILARLLAGVLTESGEIHYFVYGTTTYNKIDASFINGNIIDIVDSYNSIGILTDTSSYILNSSYGGTLTAENPLPSIILDNLNNLILVGGTTNSITLVYKDSNGDYYTYRTNYSSPVLFSTNNTNVLKFDIEYNRVSAILEDGRVLYRNHTGTTVTEIPEFFGFTGVQSSYNAIWGLSPLKELSIFTTNTTALTLIDTLENSTGLTNIKSFVASDYSILVNYIDGSSNLIINNVYSNELTGINIDSY